MDNKDIILFILVICVVYLLYCNERKESFVNGTTTSTNVNGTTTSTNVTTTATQIPENITMEGIRNIIRKEVNDRVVKKDNISISESIKNLGILAKITRRWKFNISI